MHNLLIALTSTPAPDGTLRPGVTEDQISPGTWGFLLTAFVVVLTMLLIIDMVRRLRRVRYRAQVEEQRGAARRGADSSEGEEADGGHSPSAG
ncbi:hypothetical protein [Sinomonas mesophila]|uniref:hypothetical protein n=1 Tax=Sinomonas mesophila TaxID=1531955 RepID=UPI00098788D6|nr:hypothetical protein [Sinomonas mesophila]